MALQMAWVHSSCYGDRHERPLAIAVDVVVAEKRKRLPDRPSRRYCEFLRTTSRKTDRTLGGARQRGSSICYLFRADDLFWAWSLCMKTRPEMMAERTTDPATTEKMRIVFLELSPLVSSLRENPLPSRADPSFPPLSIISRNGWDGVGSVRNQFFG